MIVPYLGLLVLVRGIGCDCVFLCGAFSCVVCVCVCVCSGWCLELVFWCGFWTQIASARVQLSLSSNLVCKKELDPDHCVCMWLGSYRMFFLFLCVTMSSG